MRAARKEGGRWHPGRVVWLASGGTPRGWTLHAKGWEGLAMNCVHSAGVYQASAAIGPRFRRAAFVRRRWRFECMSFVWGFLFFLGAVAHVVRTYVHHLCLAQMPTLCVSASATCVWPQCSRCAYLNLVVVFSVRPMLCRFP